MTLRPVSDRGPNVPLGTVSVAVDAGLYMLAEISAWNGRREIAFATTWDPESRTILTARTIGRGSPTRAPFAAELLQAGEIVVHNHPVTHDWEASSAPSDADIAVAGQLATLGIGFGILERECREVYLVTEPHTIDTSPPGYYGRAWRWGRFTLIYSRSAA